MDPSKLNEQILKALFKKVGSGSSKAVSLKQARVGFEHIDADTFFDAVAELVSERLLFDQGQGHVAFTPDGWEKAQSMASPPMSARGKKASAIGKVTPSTNQGTNNVPNPLTENMAWLIELITPNLSELKLAPAEHHKALEHLANLKRLMTGTPNPVLVKAVCSSLKNVTDEAIGNVLASGTKPAIWGAVRALLVQM